MHGTPALPGGGDIAGARLRVRLLGGFAAEHPSGQPVQLPTKKARALLALLALQPGRAHPRAKLATLLWSRTDDAQAHASLRQTLATLRKALATKDALLGGPEGLWLAPSRVEVDAVAFERCAARDGLDALERAAALYRGELLEGFDLAEEPFEEWLATERNRLRGLALDALARLVAGAAAAGEAARGVHAAQRLLALEPLDEAAHRALMRLYTQQGRGNAALHQFDLCARLLEHEFGVAPEAETRALRAEILRLRSAASPELPAPADEPAPRPGPEAGVAAEGERKRVTVLFADVVLPWAPAGGRDPEEARAVLGPAVRALSRAARRFGGSVREIPQGIMAVFGAPAAQEDHALRACCATLAMQNAADEAAASDTPTRPRPRTRVGLASGEVVLTPHRDGPGLHEIYGSPVALAAQLKELAHPGEIRLSAETAGLAQGLVRVERLPAAEAGAVPAGPPGLRLTGVAPSGTRFQAALARGLSPLVGRADELRMLHSALEQSSAGKGQVVALVGEPGVGKSRLVHEFVRSPAASGWLVLEAGAAPLGTGTPYGPVVRLLQQCLGIEGGGDPRQARGAVADALAAVEEGLKAVLDPLCALLDLPVDDPRWGELEPRQRRRRMLDAVEAVLFGLARVRPLVVVIEDLHWIDAETQAVLDLLVEGLPGAALLLLVTCRPEYRHGWHAKSYCMQLHINPLRRESARALLSALVGDDPALAALKEELIARTEGNPLFLEECVRTLVETGALAGERGAYTPGQRGCVEVPPTVQDVLAARIDRLPPDLKRLLQCAAVIGGSVRRDVLEAVLDQPPDRLERDLGELQAVEFLYRLSQGPRREYAFKHVLTREVAYGSLVKDARRALHERIAQVLEGRFPEAAAIEPELLAQHCTQAGLAEKAVKYWGQAAELAIRRSAMREAAAYLARGIEVLRTLPDTPGRRREELKLQTTLGAALIAVKGYAAPETGAAWARARELCRQVGDAVRLGPLLFGHWVFHLARAEHAAAQNAAEELLLLGERQDDETARMAGHRAMGIGLLWRGEPTAARGHLERTLELYDPERHRPVASANFGAHAAVLAVHDSARRRPAASAYAYDVRLGALVGLCFALFQLGYPEQALARHHEMVDEAQRLPHRAGLAHVLNHACMFAHIRRDDAGMRRRTAALVALAAEQDFPLWRATGLMYQGWLDAKRGQTAGGLTGIREGIAAYRATGATLFLPYWLGLLAEAHAAADRAAEGLGALAEALDTVGVTSAHWISAELHRLKGELLLALPQPDPAEAESWICRAVAVARERNARTWELRAATSLARLWCDQDKRAEARDLLAPLYGWFTEGFDTPDLKEAKAVLDELG